MTRGKCAKIAAIVLVVIVSLVSAPACTRIPPTNPSETRQAFPTSNLTRIGGNDTTTNPLETAQASPTSPLPRTGGKKPAITMISAQSSLFLVPPSSTPSSALNPTLTPNAPNTVLLTEVTVSVQVANFNIANNLEDADIIGEGHLVYYLDVDASTMSKSTATISDNNTVESTNSSNIWYNVPEGIHTFSVQLVNNDNAPLSPPVVASATGTLALTDSFPSGMPVFSLISAKVNPEPTVTGPSANTSNVSSDVIINIQSWGNYIADSLGQIDPAGSPTEVEYSMDKLPTDIASQTAIRGSGTLAIVPATIYSWRNVLPGKHVFAAELVNFDSTSLNPPQVLAVTIDVESAESASPTLVILPSQTPSLGQINLPKIQPSITGEWRMFSAVLGPGVTGKIDGKDYLFAAVNKHTDSTNLSGIVVLNIQNPDNPIKTAFLNSRDGMNILDVGLHGTVLLASVSNYLWSIDVSDPSDPRELSRLADVKARGVAVSGHYAYINNNGEKITIADISDPSHPQIIGSFTLSPDYNQALDPIQVLKISGSLLFVLQYSTDTMDPSANGLYIIDISSPDSLKQISYFPDTGAPSIGYVPGPSGGPPQTFTSNSIFSDIALYGNYALIAATGPDGMQILDISDPAAPRKIANVPQTGAEKILIAGDLAYLASGDLSFIVDVSNLDNPKGVGFFVFYSYFSFLLVGNNIYFLFPENDPTIEITDSNITPWNLRTYASTTTLTSSANPSIPGQSVTFTATVSPIPDSGTILFQDNGSKFGSPVNIDSSGKAVFTISSLLAGVHLITADYSGNNNFAGSTGVLNQKVNGEAVKFEDPNLEAVIRQAINKPVGDIYEFDLVNLTSLTAASRGIVDLSGIQYCTNLQDLFIPDNQIRDISSLSNLVKLEYLGIYNNQISDISALSNLTNLNTLVAFKNQIKDISVLSNLINLGNVELENNQITDISGLTRNQGFHTYGYIYLSDNYLKIEPGSQAMKDIQTLMDREINVVYQPQNIPPNLTSTTTNVH